MLFKVASQKDRSVKEALTDHAWLADLARGLTEDMGAELNHLATLIDGLLLRPDVEDSITWRFHPSLEYSASSACSLHFEGSIPFDGYSLIWHY